MSEYAQMETMAQRKVWTIQTSIMNQPSLQRLSNVPQTKVVKEALSAATSASIFHQIGVQVHRPPWRRAW